MISQWNLNERHKILEILSSTKGTLCIFAYFLWVCFILISITSRKSYRSNKKLKITRKPSFHININYYCKIDIIQISFLFLKLCICVCFNSGLYFALDAQKFWIVSSEHWTHFATAKKNLSVLFVRLEKMRN